MVGQVLGGNLSDWCRCGRRPLPVWLALDAGAKWLFLLAALSPLLIAYGVWERRRLGSAPDKRDGASGLETNAPSQIVPVLTGGLFPA